MTKFKTFEDLKRNNRYPDYWYGVHYWVQASKAPWYQQPAPSHELFSYCPHFIRVTWRIAKVKKPEGGPGTTPFSVAQDAKRAINNASSPTLIQPVAQNGVQAIKWTRNVLPDKPINLLNITIANNTTDKDLYALPKGAPRIPDQETLPCGTVYIFQE